MFNGFGFIKQFVINKPIDSFKTTPLNYDKKMRRKILVNNNIKQINGFKVDDEQMWLSTTNFRNNVFISLGY